MAGDRLLESLEPSSPGYKKRFEEVQREMKARLEAANAQQGSIAGQAKPSEIIPPTPLAQDEHVPGAPPVKPRPDDQVRSWVNEAEEARDERQPQKTDT